jgi:hypothetical protein
MSGLPLIATDERTSRQVSEGPNPDNCNKLYGAATFIMTARKT